MFDWGLFDLWLVLFDFCLAIFVGFEFYLRFAVGFLAIKVLMDATVLAKISFVSDMILLKLATSTIAVLKRGEVWGRFLCPMPYALCPMPARAPHVTEKGYNLASTISSIQ